MRTESADLGQVIDERTIVALPLNGRSFISLAGLVPSVALPPGSAFPRINGGRPRTNEYLFDGVTVLQPEPGQVTFMPVLDAIQEFKIETNSAPAELGGFNEFPVRPIVVHKRRSRSCNASARWQWKSDLRNSRPNAHIGTVGCIELSSCVQAVAD